VNDVTRVVGIVEINAHGIATSTGTTKTGQLVLPVTLTADVEFLMDRRLPICTKTGGFELIAGVQTAK